jgi:hypothetical protein
MDREPRYKPSSLNGYLSRQQSYVQDALFEMHMREMSSVRHFSRRASKSDSVLLEHTMANGDHVSTKDNDDDDGGQRTSTQRFLRWLTKVFLESVQDDSKGGWAVISHHPDAFTYIILYYVAVLVIAVVIIYILTAQTLSQRYLSAQPTMQGGVCNELPRSVTASYQGDIYGNWETSQAFKQNFSAFMVQFVGPSLQHTAS